MLSLVFFFNLYIPPRIREKNAFLLSQELTDNVLCHRFFDSGSHAHLTTVHLVGTYLVLYYCVAGTVVLVLQLQGRLQSLP